MSRVICPNCGRAFQALGASECPRCHYRLDAPGTAAPAPPNPATARASASSFSLAPSAPVPVPAPQAPVVRQGTNGMAVASLVLGILGILIFPLGLLAFIFGITGHVQAKKRGQAGKGLATAGIVLGSIVIVGIAVFVFLLLTVPDF